MIWIYDRHRDGFTMTGTGWVVIGMEHWARRDELKAGCSGGNLHIYSLVTTT